MQDDSFDELVRKAADEITQPVVIDVLLPGTQRVRLPDETRAAIREAVNGVLNPKRPGRRTAHTDDVGQFIDSVEVALTLHLQMRGRWPRGPHGAMRPEIARNTKADATRADCTEPLQRIAKALDKITAALHELPTDGIVKIEEGADEWLWFQAGIEDEYPSTLTVDAAPNKTSGAITDEYALERYRFLLRLEALRHGVEYARDRAIVETSKLPEADGNADPFAMDCEPAKLKPDTKPTVYDTPRLIRNIADAYERHLGQPVKPNKDRLNTPAQRVFRAVFDWLGTQSHEKALSDRTVCNYLIADGPKRV